MEIIIMPVDRRHLLRLREDILIHPLPHSNRHQHLPVVIQMEMDTHLLHLRLSNNQDSTLEVISTLGILRHLPIHGRVLVAEVQVHKEVHRRPDLTVGAEARRKAAGCNRGKQAAMEEVKVLHIAVAARVRIQPREVTVRLLLQALA